MQALKFISHVSLMLIIIATCIQCKSIPRLEKKAPTEFNAVYYQKWSAGIKEGGSGINIYLHVKDTTVVLDSVYFHGQVTELQRNPNNHTLFVGHFKRLIKDNTDAVEQAPNWHFQINDSECVISYSVAKKIHYFKISNLEERNVINYPRASSNR